MRVRIHAAEDKWRFVDSVFRVWLIDADAQKKAQFYSIKTYLE